MLPVHSLGISLGIWFSGWEKKCFALCATSDSRIASSTISDPLGSPDVTSTKDFIQMHENYECSKVEARSEV